MQLSPALGSFLLFQLPSLLLQPVDPALQLIDDFLVGQVEILEKS